MAYMEGWRGGPVKPSPVWPLPLAPRRGTGDSGAMSLPRLLRRQLPGVLVVLLLVGAMAAYRAVYVEPREWGAACLDMSQAPAACTPRAALLWLQHWQLWGLGALALGFWAFLGGPPAARIVAVALGIIATLNFNATWGMLGTMLGAWAWIGAEARAAREEPGGPGGGSPMSSIQPASDRPRTT